jgi:predicted nucleic acid-binding protein
MKLVLDASVALSWLHLPSQPFRSQAMDILDGLHGMPAHVPVVWPLEVAQGALRVERAKAAAPDVLAQFALTLRHAPVVHDLRAPAQWLGPSVSLAREHGLTVYDASYLELALTVNAALATFDRKLAAAARALGVGLAAQPDQLAEPAPHYGRNQENVRYEAGAEASARPLLSPRYTPYFVR